MNAAIPGGHPVAPTVALIDFADDVGTKASRVPLFPSDIADLVGFGIEGTKVSSVGSDQDPAFLIFEYTADHVVRERSIGLARVSPIGGEAIQLWVVKVDSASRMPDPYDSFLVFVQS